MIQKIILTLGIAMLYYYNNNEVYCDMLSQENIEIYQEIKNAIYDQLNITVRQEDFIRYYRSRFYEDVILEPKFIRNFVNKIDFQQFPAEAYEDIALLKNMIFDNFLDYVQRGQHKYEKWVLTHMFVTMAYDSEMYFRQLACLYDPLGNNAVLPPEIHNFHALVEHWKKEVPQNIIKTGLYFHVYFEDDTITFCLCFYEIPFMIKKIYI